MQLSRNTPTQVFVFLLFSVWGALLVASLFQAKKLILIAMFGATLFPLALYLSGNPRLFFLYGLVLSAPLGLSLNFKTVVHIGGAPSFSIDLMDFFLIPLLVFLVRDFAYGQRSEIRIPSLIWWWVGLIGLGALDVVLGPIRIFPSFETLRMIKLGLLFLVLVNEMVRLKHFNHVVMALLLGMFLQVAVGLVQFLLKRDLGLQFLGEAAPEAVKGANLGVYLMGGSVYRIGGLMGHPNLMSAYLALLLPIFIALLYSGEHIYKKALYLLAVMFGGLALLLTLSRSGWLSFAFGFMCLLIIAFVNPNWRQRYLPLKVGMVIGTFVLVLLASGPIIKRMTQSDSGALDFRYEWMIVALKMVKEKPVDGWGLNTFVYNMVPYTPQASPKKLIDLFGEAWPVVHNQYLLTWAEQGTLGLLLFLGLSYHVVRLALKNARYYFDDKIFAINIGALCGFLAVSLDGMASFFPRVPACGRVYWITIAIIVAIHYWNQDHIKHLRRKNKPVYKLRWRKGTFEEVPGEQ